MHCLVKHFTATGYMSNKGIDSHVIQGVCADGSNIVSMRRGCSLKIAVFIVLSVHIAHSTSKNENMIFFCSSGEVGREKAVGELTFQQVKSGDTNGSEERRYKKRKFDPGPTMILQEEVGGILVQIRIELCLVKEL